MSEPIDTIAKTGLKKIKDLDFSGNFTIKFYSREDLELLQAFFGVRASKFDMRLLDKRPELKKALEDFCYENPNR
jgi:hypothetical protein